MLFCLANLINSHTDIVDGGISMVYFWLSWLAIIYFLFLERHPRPIKRLFLWLLLLNIIFINIQLEMGTYTLTVPYLYCFIIVWALILIRTMSYFNYYVLLCLILIYNGIKYALITNPIWLLINQFLMINLVFVVILVVLIKDNQERIYLLVAASLTGELLYAYNIQVLNWKVVLGETDFFISLYIAIFILYFMQLISSNTSVIPI